MPAFACDLRRSALISALVLMALLRGKHVGCERGNADPTPSV